LNAKLIILLLVYRSFIIKLIMPKQSAGILLYRNIDTLQVFLVHPGGPFFKKDDDGIWSIPKGEFLNNEDALEAAKREFFEETGQAIDGTFTELSPVQLKSGKIIYAWAVEGDIDHQMIISDHFEMEWPPKSGRMQSFPEVDRAAWFEPAIAKIKLNPAQIKLIEQLEHFLNISKPVI
jgi:predicted NUDIX family NTP pyrophosphohydrolase